MQPTHYLLTQKYPHSEFLQLTIKFNVIQDEGDENIVQLPSWRPGRYQLGNFSQNIRNFQAFNDQGQKISFEKITKESWAINIKGLSEFIIRYEFYAKKIDGGSTYVDEDLWYINFINCLLYQPSRIKDACLIELNIPDNWTIASSLEQDKKILRAQSFYELVDSPVIAAKEIIHYAYKVEEINFHIWMHGNISIDQPEKMVEDFENFSKEQLSTIGDFETSDYHFLMLFLDQKAYHGVEHLSSTCIVLGPAENFNEPDFYNNLLGISSHELFHYWNIIRIRPYEMYPYNFTAENYFTTGFVAEGVTTYYGDLFLVRSGVKSIDWYINELNLLFKRHFENYGRHVASLANSSFDLWVDGYEPGVPARKVSIYVKGAIIALILELRIISNTHAKNSLDDVIRSLYYNYYKKSKGFKQKEYLKIAEDVSGLNLQKYEEDYILGTEPVEKDLKDLFLEFGFDFKLKHNSDHLAHYLGLKTQTEEKGLRIIQTAYNSIGEKNFRIDDLIISINNRSVSEGKNIQLSKGKEVKINFIRKGLLKEIFLEPGDSHFYCTYEISEMDNIGKVQELNRHKWLKH